MDIFEISKSIFSYIFSIDPLNLVVMFLGLKLKKLIEPNFHLCLKIQNTNFYLIVGGQKLIEKGHWQSLKIDMFTLNA